MSTQALIWYYVFLSVVVAFVNGFWLSHAKPTKMRRARFGANLAAAGIIANIVYRGLYGWKPQPESKIELLLDLLTSACVLFGFLIMQRCAIDNHKDGQSPKS